MYVVVWWYLLPLVVCHIRHGLCLVCPSIPHYSIRESLLLNHHNLFAVQDFHFIACIKVDSICFATEADLLLGLLKLLSFPAVISIKQRLVVVQAKNLCFVNVLDAVVCVQGGSELHGLLASVGNAQLCLQAHRRSSSIICCLFEGHPIVRFKLMIPNRLCLLTGLQWEDNLSLWGF